MANLITFILLSIPIVWLSWRTLFSFHNHGLYRFISWEFILWLLLKNYSFWFINPFSVAQIVSWISLTYSLHLIITGSLLIKTIGKADATRVDDSLYYFERTTELVETGIFKYVRHPLYGSLIFLTWGIFFKNINTSLLVISMLSTIFLFLTSLVEEKEDLKYFGERYRDYMKRTKMFVPYLL